MILFSVQLAIVMIGASAVVGAVRSTDPVLKFGAIPTLGIAIIALSGWMSLVLVLLVGSDWAATAVIMSTLFAVGCIARWGVNEPRRLVSGAIWGVFAFALSRSDTSFYTFDSVWMIGSAGIQADLAVQVADFTAFPPGLLGFFLGQDLLGSKSTMWPLPLLAWFSTIFMVIGGVRVICRTDGGSAAPANLLAIAAGALFLLDWFPWFAGHYNHAHTIIGASLLLAAVQFSRDGKTGNGDWIALLSLMSIVTIRFEGILVGSLVLTAMASRRPGEQYKAMGNVWCCFCLCFLATLMPSVMQGGGEIIGMKSLVGLAFVACIPRIHHWIHATWKWPPVWAVPGLGFLAVGAVLGLLVFLDHVHQVENAISIAHNILAGGWGSTWLVLLVPIVAAAGLSRARAPLWYLLLTLLISVLVLGALRIPYRLGWGDSANRMLLHYFPLAILVGCTSFHTLMARRAAGDCEPSHPKEPSG